MNIPKCDICKKKMDENSKKYYIAKDRIFGGYDICGNCGKPLQEFLSKNKLVNTK